jgi:histidine triad (HIT) family protein
MAVYEDADLLGFRDINPQAPVHILVIPKKHYKSLNELTEADTSLMGRLVLAGRQIAAQEKLADCGYRMLFNCGEDGGQSVAHIHMHVLGGRQLKWPPG